MQAAPATFLSALMMTASVPYASAQAASAHESDGTFSFSISAQSLSAALREFAEATGLQLIYTPELVAGVRSAGVSGKMTAVEALDRLLTNSGVGFRFANDSTVTLQKQSEQGVRTLGPVRVEGLSSSPVSGINGSRDITATEGTGSFTSGALAIGGKSPMSIKDTPQSVSVITQLRLEEQNINDFTDALAEAPGITLVQGATSVENTFYSRGFEISSIQVDGGAPFVTRLSGARGTVNVSGYFPQIDMAQYDHVELLRGPSAYFNGYGDPSGTVNLVRKKPLNHEQVIVEAQAGSWDNNRLVMDVTAPLTADGRLRGRGVVSYQENDFFYDVATNNSMLIYGIVEYDLTPSTLLTAGISSSHKDTVPWKDGLPRYQNGDDLRLSRDTCLCFFWNVSNFDTTELFGSVEQKIGERWTAKLNVTHSSQENVRKLGNATGAVNPLTSAGVTLNAALNDYASEQLSAEVTLAGAFEVFGQRQQIILGINRVDTDGGGYIQYEAPIAGTVAVPYQPYAGGPTYYSGSPYGARPPIDVFNFDPNDPRYNEPRDPLRSARYREMSQVQTGGYLNLRLQAFDHWHLTTGLRLSRYEYDYAIDGLCTSIPTDEPPAPDNCVGRQIGDAYGSGGMSYGDTDFTWPPALALSYDLGENLSTYVSYNDIYQSQANSLDRELNPVEPLTGANIEVGSKWHSSDGRLNATLAVYRIEQEGFAQVDPDSYGRNPDGSIDRSVNVDNAGNSYVGGEVSPGTLCCYRTDFDITRLSQGVDLEVGGELLPDWQLSVGYTYNENESRGKNLALLSSSPEGTPLVSRQPEHLVKLWTSYRLPEGWVRGLTLSGGVHAQSKAYAAGTACARLNPPNSMGVSSCASGQNLPYEFTQSSYAIFAARAEFRVLDHWAIALNVDNLTDTRYYSTMGTSTSGNWYGEPRSFTLSLRGQW